MTTGQLTSIGNVGVWNDDIVALLVVDWLILGCGILSMVLAKPHNQESISTHVGYLFDMYFTRFQGR